MNKPVLPAGQAVESAWLPRSEVFNFLYFLALVAGISLAAGTSGVILQSSNFHRGAGVNVTSSYAGVDNRIDLAARVRQASFPLVEAELKPYYLACSSESATQHMKFGQAAICGKVTDRLLVEVFAGDVNRMAEWRRAQVDLGASY